MKNKNILICSLFIVFLIYLLIRYIMNRESFINNCKTQDVINNYNTLTNLSPSLNNVDPQTVSNYNNALSLFTSTYNKYNSIQDCSVSCAGGTVNSGGFCVCPVSAPIPNLSNGNIVCSQNDTNTVYNCIPGTTYTYSPCVNGQSTRTRAGDIQPLNGGSECQPITDNVTCSDCKATYTTTPFTNNSNKITTTVSNITPAVNGGTCNITPSSTVSCINKNFLDTVNCQYCNQGWFGTDCSTPTTQTITKSGTYTIPQGVTHMVVTVIGGGGGGSLIYGSISAGFYTLNGRPGQIVLPGQGAGDIVISPIPVYGNTSFNVQIGSGGSFYSYYRSGTSAKPNQGGSSGFSIGSINIGAVGGVGGWAGIVNTTEQKPKVEIYGPTYQTGFGYGDGGNSQIICVDTIANSADCKTDGKGGNGIDGCVIVTYMAISQSIPASIANNGQIDVMITSSLSNIPIPSYAKNVSVLVVGGGGGGWYGGVTGVTTLPAAFANYNYNLYFFNPTYATNSNVLYGAGPGSGGASGQYVINNNISIQPGSMITITIGSGGAGGIYTGVGNQAGTSIGTAPGNGSTTTVTIGSTVISAAGGFAATDPITPGASNGNSNAGIKFGSYTTNSLTKYQYAITGLAPIYQNFRPDQGTPGGALSFTDSLFGVNMPTTSYLDTNGSKQITNINTSLGCGGKGGDAYVKSANYPYGSVVAQQNQTGGVGGNGYVRLIFSR